MEPLSLSLPFSGITIFFWVSSGLSLSWALLIVAVGRCHYWALLIVAVPNKAHVDTADNVIRNISLISGGISIKALGFDFSNIEREDPALLFNSKSGGLKNTEFVEDKNEAMLNIIVHREVPRFVHTPECPCGFFEETNSGVLKPITVEQITACVPDPEGVSIRRIQNPGKEAENDGMGLISTAPSTENNNSPVLPYAPFAHPCSDAMRSVNEVPGIMAGGTVREEPSLIDSGTCRGDVENCVRRPQDTAAQMGEGQKDVLEVMGIVNRHDIKTSFLNEIAAMKVDSQGIFPLAEPFAYKMQPTKSTKLKTVPKDTLTPGIQFLVESIKHNRATNSPKQKNRHGRVENFSTKQKMKQSRKNMMHAKENRADRTSIAPNDELEPKVLPNFDSFIIEEEEGSGGYGTVYRARAQRKNDGKTFAIKCPHANAHSHHVNNELKMLERFGGRHFVIKYEGSFKSGSSECFVLEHVEHDRPEVLKKEIDSFQLQWYGYCLFRALASLHRQGIVHRDVKPGNFLFSRKLNKGYLIDFNLAMDPHQKYSNASGKVLSSRSLAAPNQVTTKDSKSAVELNKIKQRVDVGHLKAYPDMSTKNIFKSQGADGSGITSAKDATSNRTPSVERLREPLPCQGRKELISLLQEAIESPNHGARTVPASQRKRVAAPPGNVENKLLYLTPMPLHSTGIAISGSGSFKNKGEAKNKREGPCVGTKGFRAPEVLFRSPYQGCKADVWSAGVTLLYLLIGRTPFVGDREQNIKDIAKLRGSEDLWEVAKLHNRESSFPTELLDIRYLPSTGLREWCKMNTKRPDIMETIPKSLFDLVDKCLTVNPRLRISSEEALRHQFFTPCHEVLKKQRLLRRGLSLESESEHHSQGQIIRPVNIMHKQVHDQVQCD